MGMTYIDSNIAVYAVQDPEGRGAEVVERLAHSDDDFVISPLVRMEVMVVPIRTEDYVLRAHYERFLSSFDQVLLGVAEFARAAELRAWYGLKTPDALHLAAAQHHGCEAFWTNDDRLRSAAGAVSLRVF